LHCEFRPGRSGRKDGAPGVVVREITHFSLASVVARKGQALAASAAAQTAFGTALPPKPACVTGHDLAFVWSGPGHWLALGPELPAGIEARVGAGLGERASVFDQGGSRVLLEIAGPRVRDTLAKGIELDLHPHAFRPGDAAVTTASHIGVHLWQVAEDPVYRLLVVRTYFGSLWRWLSTSAAACGCEVRAPLPYSHGL
jgi:sarcosine oxidase subunit gamma